jgi:hypothetical protein
VEESVSETPASTTPIQAKQTETESEPTQPDQDSSFTQNDQDSSFTQNDQAPDYWSNIRELINSKSTLPKQEITVQPLLENGHSQYEFVEIKHQTPHDNNFLQNQLETQENLENSNGTNPTPENQETQGNQDSSEENQVKEENNLEILAREIYSLIRDKIEVERERNGGYYFNRKNW